MYVFLKNTQLIPLRQADERPTKHVACNIKHQARKEINYFINLLMCTMLNLFHKPPKEFTKLLSYEA